jgi:hypothetical protein
MPVCGTRYAATGFAPNPSSFHGTSSKGGLILIIYLVFRFPTASTNFWIKNYFAQIINFSALGGQANLIAVRRAMPSNLFWRKIDIFYVAKRRKLVSNTV